MTSIVINGVPRIQKEEEVKPKKIKEPKMPKKVKSPKSITIPKRSNVQKEPRKKGRKPMGSKERELKIQQRSEKALDRYYLADLDGHIKKAQERLDRLNKLKLEQNQKDFEKKSKKDKTTDNKNNDDVKKN